jgi:ABC-2 type transport system ATP-binding protein
MKILSIENLKKIYNNGKIALHDISLQVEKGQFLALLGPNGAGKSSLINILGDCVVKTSGLITLDGFDIDKDKLDFKRNIGIVPQDLNFDPFFTPFEVLGFQQGLYGIKKNTQTITDLLVQLGLKEQIHYPARALSGGMKRRLLIAKALIHNPQVIILDEPTAGVDIELRQHIWDFLKKLNSQGKTIILTTHYLEEAQYLCDKVAIINGGKLIANENKKDLIDRVGSKSIELVLSNSNNDNLKLSYKYMNLNENTISISYNKDEDIGKIMQEVLSNNITISSMNIKQASLEEVFLLLTKNK